MVLPVLFLFVFFWFSLLYQVSFAVVVLQLLSVSVVFIIKCHKLNITLPINVALN